MARTARVDSRHLAHERALWHEGDMGCCRYACGDLYWYAVAERAHSFELLLQCGVYCLLRVTNHSEQDGWEHLVAQGLAHAHAAVVEG
jgi:hypothetical protein